LTPTEPVFGPPGGRDLHLSRRYSRWAIWGCLALVLAGALMIGGAVILMLRDPKVWRAAENLARCQARMQAVSSALGRYNEDKGHLPAGLDDLYPIYLADKVNLRCPSDPTKGSASSYVLRTGVSWGEGNAVLVYCPHHPAKNLMPGKAANEAAVEAGNVVPIIYQNGRVDREIAPLDRFRKAADGDVRKR
jgi:hypothetical protein